MSTISITKSKTAPPQQHPTWGVANPWVTSGPRTDLDYEIRFRFDYDLVQLLKDTIPGHERQWDSDRKLWRTTDQWARAFAAVCRRKGHTVIGIPGAGPPKVPPPPPAPVISWADVLLARCGTAELREKVYKNLSKALHADLGGDGTLQQELNDARAQYHRQEGSA